MKSKLAKIIEVAANVAIIIVAAALVAVLVRNYLMPRAPRGAVADAPPVAAGTKLPLTDVDWAKNGQTLVLVLQKGCHFCTESAPFYQRLATGAAGRNDLKLVAVLPQDVEEGKRYLTALGVKIDEVKQSPPGALGTPTLILVNNTGTVVDSWIGKLRPEKESEVLSRLKI